MSAPSVKASKGPLVVIVSGGGPVGLTFSLHLTMMMGKHVKIIIYEGRWYVDGHGRTRWQDEAQGKTRRDQVVTLQDHVITQMPEYIQEGLFKRINECVWPTSRNIPIKEVEDRLLDLIQPFVGNGQVELIPENLHEQTECLIKGNFDILVGADGANSFVRRYCNIQMISEGVEYACGVAYKIPDKVERKDEPLHQALNCILTVSQTRYLVNSSTSRRGYLNIRLIHDEYTELTKRLEVFKSRNEPLDLLDYNKFPKSPVWSIIRQGLDYFQIPSKYVIRVVPIEINVRHASIVVRELRFEIDKSEQQNKDLEDKEYKTALAFLAGDAAMNVHFWPGRGMNSGMKGAIVLARNILRTCTSKETIHIRTPLRFLDFLDYEGFMARLRAREQQGRSLRILVDPIDKYIETSFSYANVSLGYEKYIKKLLEKLQETRKRLEERPEWPHKTKQVTNDELQFATNRISPEAVAQLSLANPWPTREMGGLEVLVEHTFPYDRKNFLPVPMTAITPPSNVKQSPVVIIRNRFISLWVIGTKKMENIEKLIENIQKSENFAKTSNNSEGLHQLKVVQTIEEAKIWINSNREAIRKPHIRFKVVTLWTINDNQTAVDVIRAVRSQLPRAPVLIFTNKHEETQPALEFPNVMETDTEFELKEFIGINQETQWNAGCQTSRPKTASLPDKNSQTDRDGK